MTPLLDPLPVDAVLPDVISALRRHRAAVLQAEPGAGKTTRVPPALLDAGLAASAEHPGRILVLEPRRVAARAACRRIAEERGWRVGEEVGYQVRFDRRDSVATRILFVTAGVLVQRLQTDPFLEDVAAVIFDEFHERALDLDLAFAMARRVQREARPELLLLAMSATLEVGPLTEALGGAPLIACAGGSCSPPTSPRLRSPSTASTPSSTRGWRARCASIRRSASTGSRSSASARLRPPSAPAVPVGKGLDAACACGRAPTSSRCSPSPSPRCGASISPGRRSNCSRGVSVTPPPSHGSSGRRQRRWPRL